MGTRMIAFYEDWTHADAVVDQLLNVGLSPADIELKSGHYWLEAIAETDSRAVRPIFHLGGVEVVVEVTIPSEDLTDLVQARLFESGLLGLQVREDDRKETWVSIPMTVTYIQTMSLYR